MSESDQIGTDLYRSMLAYDYGAEERTALQKKVWSGTPWMVDCYTGGDNERDREQEIREWCTERFGPEAWPIHGHAGKWHRGGATINGWTWMGFKTKEMMEEFLAEWPTPEGIKKGKS